jgi:hypothetical protein
VMSFTLIGIQDVPELQLLQQPGFHQDRSLAFLYSTCGIESVGKNECSFTVDCEGRKEGRGTNPLIIILPNIRSWAVSFTLRASYRRYTVARMMCGLQCRSELFVKEVILLPLLVSEPQTPIMQSSQTTGIKHKVPKQF